MSTVSIVPGASTEKLPFVHSKFKARSKFAKSFGGCSRFAKARAAGLAEPEDSVKLPRITYNARDSRTVIAFGAPRRGTRREYPGFAGSQKSQSRKNGKASATSNSGASTSRSTEDLSVQGKLSERPASKEDFVLDGRHNMDAVKDDTMPSMNSLFIIDEASFEGSPNTPGLPKRDVDTTDILGQKNALKVKEDTIFETDPFAREFGDRLKDSRGKSGVKRGKKVRHDHHRALGDIMTTKRLQELLSPRQQTVQLKFG